VQRLSIWLQPRTLLSTCPRLNRARHDFIFDRVKGLRRRVRLAGKGETQARPLGLFREVVPLTLVAGTQVVQTSSDNLFVGSSDAWQKDQPTQDEEYRFHEPRSSILCGTGD
jgi:hypothetical protein